MLNNNNPLKYFFMNKPVLFLDPASIYLHNGILSNQSDANLKMTMGLILFIGRLQCMADKFSYFIHSCQKRQIRQNTDTQITRCNLHR